MGMKQRKVKINLVNLKGQLGSLSYDDDLDLVRKGIIPRELTFLEQNVIACAWWIVGDLISDKK